MSTAPTIPTDSIHRSWLAGEARNLATYFDGEPSNVANDGDAYIRLDVLMRGLAAVNPQCVPPSPGTPTARSDR